MKTKIVAEALEYTLELYKFKDDIVDSIEQSITYYENKYSLTLAQKNELRQLVMDSLNPEVFK